MATENIKSELAALRAEVAALAAAREAQAASRETPRPPPDGTALSNGDTTTMKDHESGFMGEMHELVELLEHEMRETPMVTGLVVFSLGVLLGRFLR